DRGAGPRRRRPPAPPALGDGREPYDTAARRAEPWRPCRPRAPTHGADHADVRVHAPARRNAPGRRVAVRRWWPRRPLRDHRRCTPRGRAPRSTAPTPRNDTPPATTSGARAATGDTARASTSPRGGSNRAARTARRPHRP